MHLKRRWRRDVDNDDLQQVSPSLRGRSGGAEGAVQRRKHCGSISGTLQQEEREMDGVRGWGEGCVAHAAKALCAGCVPEFHVQLAVGQLHAHQDTFGYKIKCPRHLQALLHEGSSNRRFGCARR